jgi:hypothetical protein
MHLFPSVAIQPNLELKTQPKLVLGSLPLAFALPALAFENLVTPKGGAKHDKPASAFNLLFIPWWDWGVFVEHLSPTWVTHQRVTKIIPLAFKNLVTLKAGAKHELLFNKPIWNGIKMRLRSCNLFLYLVDKKSVDGLSVEGLSPHQDAFLEGKTHRKIARAKAPQVRF